MKLDLNLKKLDPPEMPSAPSSLLCKNLVLRPSSPLTSRLLRWHTSQVLSLPAFSSSYP